MQSEAKKEIREDAGVRQENSGVDFLRGGSFVYCDMGDASRADAGGERTRMLWRADVKIMCMI